MRTYALYQAHNHQSYEITRLKSSKRLQFSWTPKCPTGYTVPIWIPKLHTPHLTPCLPVCLLSLLTYLLTYLLKIECRCHEKSKRKKALCLFQVNHLDTYRGWQVAEPLEATAATPRRGLYSFRWGQGAPPELWGSFSIWRWRTIRLTHRPPLSSHSFSSRACQENLVQFDQRWESRSCKSVNTL